MEQTCFKIDFLMLRMLTESAFCCKTVLESTILHELVDKHYDVMSEQERRSFFEHFKDKYDTDAKFLLDKDSNDLWRLILARYNPNNRFRIGKDTKTVYFQLENRFYRNTRQYVESTNELEIIRLTNP